MVEQWHSDNGTVERLWKNSGTDMVEQWNGYGEIVEQ